MEALLSCFLPLSGKIISIMSPLVLSEILGVFVITLTANGKYPVQDCENLQLPSEMHISEKPKAFSQLFIPFLESSSNVKHFGKEDGCRS